MQPLTSCVHNIQVLGVTLGDTVLVLGQGVMGLNSAQAAKAAGADTVIGTDMRPEILEMAKELGIDVTIDASKENVCRGGDGPE